MDELTLLRTLDADAAPATPQSLTRAFNALTAEMTATHPRTGQHTPSKRRRRTRRLRWAALTSAGAFALIVTLVATDVVGIAGLRPGATAQAAELLDQAADNTIRTADPVLRPGQLRQISSTIEHFTSSNNPAGDDIAYSIRERGTIWIPANELDVWTEVRYPIRFTGQVYGPDAHQVAQREDTQMAKVKPQVVHGAAGTQWGGTPTWTPTTIAALPRDPHLLLDSVYLATIGHGQSRPGEAFVMISDILRTGLVPADLRAAAYRAIALIPGVTITAHIATLNHQDGVAFGLTEQTTGIRSDLIIDPRTGDFIGERRVTTRPIDLYPVDLTIDWSSVDTTVVDQVPVQYQP